MDEQTRKDLMDAISLATANAYARAAYDMEREAKRICPVDTGALRASIHLRETKKGKIQIVAGKNYAHYVEFGTYRQRPQPYIRPAMHAMVMRFFPERLFQELKLMSKNFRAYREIPREQFYKEYVEEPRQRAKQLRPFRRIASKMRRGAKLLRKLR
jgi:HK97 gp10 family phage protein